MFTRIMFIAMFIGIGIGGFYTQAQGNVTPEERYQQALRDYRNKAYAAALDKFKDACEADATYRDACLYWMASSSFKLGNLGEAQDHLADFFEHHHDSSWTEDARALEAEILAETGIAFEGEDLETLSPATAMMFLSNLETEEAISLIEKILAQKGASRYREQALFALTQHNDDRARKILQKYAAEDDGILGRLAIQYLGLSGAKENLNFLKSHFDSVKKRQKKEELLSAFMLAGDYQTLEQIATSTEDRALAKSSIMLLGAMGKKDSLFRLYEHATSQHQKQSLLHGIGITQDKAMLRSIFDAETDPLLKETAIVQLGIAQDCQTLDEIYQTEENLALRMKCLDAFLIASSCDNVLRIVQTETHPDLIIKAIFIMGALHGKYKDELVEIYRTTDVFKEKQAVIQAFLSKKADEELIEIAKTEPNKELKIQAVRVLGIMKTEKAKAYLKSLLDL